MKLKLNNFKMRIFIILQNKPNVCDHPKLHEKILIVSGETKTAQIRKLVMYV